MSIGRWSHLSAEQELRCTGDERFLVITISNNSRGARGCMGWFLGCPFQKSGRSSRRHNHVGVPPSRAQPRVPIHMFGVEVAGHHNRQSPAETGDQISSGQWVGGRKVSRKDYHRFAGQYDLNGSSLQMSQSRNGHRVADYTTANQDHCTARYLKNWPLLYRARLLGFAIC